jgi:hypothetical protein
MKNLNYLTPALIAAALVAAPALYAQDTVTVDPTTLTFGYMNWSPVPTDAPGYGGSGSSAWGLSALPATFSGSTLTLAPNVNTYAPGVNYWVNADGSGANIMDANVYSETSGTYVGVTLTFTFNVLANTLVAPYTSVAFIKDFASDYSSYTQATVALTPGVDSVVFNTSANPGDHIQYGFETDGPDANPATVAALGSIVIAPVPEPSTIALISTGIAGLMGLRRSRKA